MSDSPDNVDKSPESDGSSEGVLPMEEDIQAILEYHRLVSPLSPIKSENSPPDIGGLQSEDEVSLASNISTIATKGGDTDEFDSEKSHSVSTEMDASDQEEALQRSELSEEMVNDDENDLDESNLAPIDEIEHTSGSNLPGEEPDTRPRTASVRSVDELSNFSDMSLGEKQRVAEAFSAPTDGDYETSSASDVSVPRAKMVNRNPSDAVGFRIGHPLNITQSERNPVGEQTGNFPNVSTGNRSVEPRSILDESAIPPARHQETRNILEFPNPITSREQTRTLGDLNIRRHEDPGNVSSDASISQYSGDGEDARLPIPIGRQEDPGNVSSDMSIPQYSGDSDDTSMADISLQRQMSNRAPVPAELNECLSDECFSVFNLSSFAAADLNAPSETFVEHRPTLSTTLDRPSVNQGEENLPRDSSGVLTVSVRDPVVRDIDNRPGENLQVLDNPTNASNNSMDTSDLKADSGFKKSSKSCGSGAQVTAPPKSKEDTPIPHGGESSSSHMKSKSADDKGRKGVGETSQQSESASTGADFDTKGTHIEGKLVVKKKTKRGMTKDQKMDASDGVISPDGSPTKQLMKEASDDAAENIVAPPVVTKDSKGGECDDALANQGARKAKDLSPTKKAPKRGLTNPDTFESGGATSNIKVNVESESSEVAREQSQSNVTDGPITDSISPTKKSRHTATIKTLTSTSSGGDEGAKSANLEVPASSVGKERSSRTPRKPRTKVQTPISDRITRSKLKEQEEREKNKK